MNEQRRNQPEKGQAPKQPDEAKKPRRDEPVPTNPQPRQPPRQPDQVDRPAHDPDAPTVRRPMAK